MKAIPPLPITPTRLTSTTASSEPAPGEISWSATEICAAGDRRILAAPSATVTISNASPAVVTWAGNNLSETTSIMLSTAGALPAPLAADTMYYIRDRLGADTFTLATTPFGAAISTTSAGSGVHTATAHVHREYEAIAGARSTVTLSNASPGVVSWPAHGRQPNDPVVFTTTGGLPAPIVAGQTYYVTATSFSSEQFTVASTVGGAAINTTTAGSGTHTGGLAANYNKPPLLNPDVWEDLRPTNKWAMFDTLRNTATRVASPLTVVITPGTRIDALGLAGVDADTVQVTATSATYGGSVYNSGAINLYTRPVANWYQYFFKLFKFLRARAFFNLPPYSDLVITVTLTRTGGEVSCGALVVGMQGDMGGAKRGAIAEKLNFTKVTRDEWGNATVVKSTNKPAIKVDLYIEKANLDAFNDLEDSLNGEVAFFAGVENSDDGYFQTLQVLGFLRRVTKNLALPNHVFAQTEIEEV